MLDNPIIDRFLRGPSPLQDDAVRDRLQQAILNNDSILFRTTLAETHPELVAERRLYGLLIMTPEGLRPLMVDESGKRIEDPEYVMPAGIPIDMLNVKITDSELIVTIDGNIWKAPYRSAGASQ